LERNSNVERLYRQLAQPHLQQLIHPLRQRNLQLTTPSAPARTRRSSTSRHGTRPAAREGDTGDKVILRHSGFAGRTSLDYLFFFTTLAHQLNKPLRLLLCQHVLSVSSMFPSFFYPACRKVDQRSASQQTCPLFDNLPEAYI
jgi:hypothetical protein